jgi:glycerol-3-phosphate dehydrogenase (NAD(P)+)
VEIGGALKNIVALGAGLVDGLSLGDNAKAAYMTRGLAEIMRLGLAMDAKPATLAGLAGLGDVLATCSSRLSRNHQMGEQLAKGRTREDIQLSTAHTAEGVTTTVAARDLARLLRVEMPITEQLYQVLFEGKNPADAVSCLMARLPRYE